MARDYAYKKKSTHVLKKTKCTHILKFVHYKLYLF